MLNIICTLGIVVNCGLGGIGCWVESNIKGRIIEESKTKYVVDFSEGLKGKNLIGSPNEYKEVVINASECVKLKNGSK